METRSSRELRMLDGKPSSLKVEATTLHSPSPLLSPDEGQLSDDPLEDLSSRIKGRRHDVQLKRLQLDEQRARYVQGRDRFGKGVAALIEAVEAAISTSASLSENESLRESYERFRETTLALEREENITKGLENDLSRSEYWLTKDETQFYEPDEESQTTEEEGSDQVEVATSTNSYHTQSTKSLSLFARIRRKTQLVVALREQLDELEYDHQQEMGMREWRESHGEKLRPSNSRFFQRYEWQKESIAKELQETDREIRAITAQSARTAVLADNTVETTPWHGKWPPLMDGVLRRFPGTYNGTFGIGLPQDKVATGMTPWQERLRQWLWNVYHERATTQRQSTTPNSSPRRVSRNLIGNSFGPGEEVGRPGPEWSIANEEPDVQNRPKFSIWYGDQPDRAYSNPDLHLYQSTGVGSPPFRSRSRSFTSTT